MKYLLLLCITFLSASLCHAQSDTLGLSINQEQVQSLKMTSDTIQIITDSITKLNDQKETILQQNQELVKANESLQKQGKSLISNNNILKANNEKLDSINTQLAQQQNLANIKIAEQQTKIKALQDSIDDKSKKINEKDSTLKEKNTSIQKADDVLKQREAAIAKQMDSLETIAKIEMRDSIKLYYWGYPKKGVELRSFEKPYNIDVKPGNHPPVIKIQQVNITVKEGMMLEIIVQTDSGIYRNSKSINDLLHLVKIDKTQILFHEHQSYNPGLDKSCIFLDDVIKYTPIRSYNDVAYGDFDITLMPNDKDRTYLLRESTSINTYFNIAAFTDIKGITGEPNGLAQFTAEAKFISNTHSITPTAIVLLNYIAFKGGLSKFDNDFKGTELINNDSINRKDLFQRANYSLGVKLNLFKWFLSPRPKILYDKVELNIGYNFLGTKVFDTVFKDQARTVIDTTYRSVTQNQWYIEPLITFSRHRNFAMTISVPFYFNTIKHNATADPGIKNIGLEVWAAPGINLMYFGKRDTGSKLFFRYNNYINLNNKTQSFTQMQLGYSLNLTDILGAQ